MRVIFREEAEHDLRAVLEWFGGFGPDTATRAYADIYRSINLLIDFPNVGMEVAGTTARRIVTRRYRFKIVYKVGVAEIAIVGIFRFQNRIT